ncbi:MAG: hypothetical protein ACSHWS_11715 [Sulfitobacter sp.]
MPDHFDNIKDWLIGQSLSDDPIAVTVMELLTRLLDGGVPISRMSIGRSILHPAIGIIEMRWDRDSGQVTTKSHPRNYAVEVQQLKNPLIDLIKSNRDRLYADLTNLEEVACYEMFAKIAAKGDTGYAAFKRAFGMSQVLNTIVATEFRGAILSFSTDRLSGFSQADLAGSNG